MEPYIVRFSGKTITKLYFILAKDSQAALLKCFVKNQHLGEEGWEVIDAVDGECVYQEFFE